VKKSVFTTSPLKAEKELNWYKFDDDIVSEFSKEMLSTLYGEGTFLSALLFFSECFRNSDNFDCCRRRSISVCFAIQQPVLIMGVATTLSLCKN